MISDIPHVKDAQVDGKRVFLRCDLNVPLDDWAGITDTTRIDASMRTIKFLLEKGAKLIIASHLGRPKGKPDPAFSLKPVAAYLSKLLEWDVPLVDNYAEGDIPAAITSLPKENAVLLENLRFNPGETTNDPAFAQRLASLAEIYVNDAFGTCHRAHASVVGLAEHLPHYGGFLIFDELQNLSKLLSVDDSRKPFVAVLGGAKVSDKLGIIQNLFNKVDAILIGGGMAFTFLKAQGHSIGRSLVEDAHVATAADFIKRAAEMGVKLELPEDLIIAEDNQPDAEWRISGVDIDDPLWMGLDIGPKTISKFRGYLVNARTVFINGPMGVFEHDPFENGTRDIFRLVAGSNAFSVIGGGDTIAAANKFQLTGRFTFVSTGGGASLEFLSGIELPGLKALAS